MISKISVNDITGRNSSVLTRHEKDTDQNPSFKGVGALALAGLQACERMPMINVAVIDMLSAILPRTIVERMTNGFAGFEAFRRESSGLIVNCMILGVITWLIARCLNPAFMPSGISMSRSWADGNMLTKASGYYDETFSGNKVEKALTEILRNMSGFDRNNHVMFEQELGQEQIKEYAKQLSDISKENISDKELSKRVKKISDEIISKTHIAEHVELDGIKGYSVKSLLTDSVKFYKEFQKTNGKMDIKEFSSKCFCFFSVFSILISTGLLKS